MKTATKEKKLTPKQERFIQEYLVDCNATQAAIRAGYSAKTAASIGDENLRKPEIKDVIELRLRNLAAKTETDAEWVRRRLKEEADDFSEFSSHSARIRAIELVGKINGVFEIDNKQKGDPLRELLGGLKGKVIGVATEEEEES